MNVFEMAKNYYDRGLWSFDRIKKLFEAGKLTAKEANIVVGNNVNEE